MVSLVVTFVVGLIVFLPFPSCQQLVGFVTSATVLSFASGPLVLAAHSGFDALVDFLLEAGADVNSAEAGFGALHEAILRRNEHMVTALLAHGAAPNAPLKAWTPTRRSSKDYNFAPELVGATPFWLAARFNEPEGMRLLLARGVEGADIVAAMVALAVVTTLLVQATTAGILARRLGLVEAPEYVGVVP